MTNLTDIQFDHKAAATKRRGFGVPITYEQNGVIFNSGFVAIAETEQAKKEPKPKIVKPPPEKKEFSKEPVAKPLTARDRAAEKLKGYAAPETTDEVQTALNENKAAALAEDKAL